ncbi:MULTISPECIES: metal-dependent hydrolase [Shouchella]|uniref:Metal-dependent hydrolase n=2 Tax=Shouchella TaxID=2893057 RepID=A0ABY7W1I1_9BACI|nr:MULTISPECIES: metal-dependent hydrolase [Shouchella]MED4130363.1 metal-dependent hydrolase [Shouchella miscanthi]WDF02719.1 metal-dependent hydrolase [Shouchella hunanensis]
MDTSTHIVMGVGLAGLATLDPNVSASPYMATAVLATTLVASNAPDFDTILKLRNNAVYIRHHRGITHSLPALFLWPFIVSGGLMLFFQDAYWPTLLLWAAISVFLHVFVDIFNAYGTQALRPISNRWIALGVINIFDPVIFGSHVFGIMLWILGLPPGPAFIGIYLFLICYYVWRYKQKQKVVRQARQIHPNASHIFVSPTIRWNKWHLVIRTPDMLYVAQSKDRVIHFFESYTFDPIPNDSVMQAARSDKNLAAFLSFSPTYRWEMEATDDNGYEVRFVDLRYRSNGYYPFVAIVKMDEQLNVITSYTGWVYSEETLRKKLKIIT